MSHPSSLISVFINYLMMANLLSPGRAEHERRVANWGIYVGLPTGPVNLPLPTNPMAVTSSSFELLPDKIGFKLAINYACGVTLAMETFLNQSLVPGIGVGSVGQVPVVGGIVGGGGKGRRVEDDGTVEQVAKYVNPIVLVGSTCIQLGGFCGKYNVNNNAMSVE